MTFSEACHILKLSVDNKQFTLIKRYAHHITWSFRFERKGKQYGCLEVLYLTFTGKETIDFLKAYNESHLSVTDRVALISIESGTWNKPPLLGQFDDRRDEFKRITEFPC